MSPCRSSSRAPRTPSRAPSASSPAWVLADVSSITRRNFPAASSSGSRALAPHPAILVADEPTGNLDEATGSEIVDLMFAGRAARNTTLVLVTHDANLAARCDRVVRLRSGRVEPAAPAKVIA